MLIANKKTIVKDVDDGLAFKEQPGKISVLTAELPKHWAATPHRSFDKYMEKEIFVVKKPLI